MLAFRFVLHVLYLFGIPVNLNQNPEQNEDRNIGVPDRNAHLSDVIVRGVKY